MASLIQTREREGAAAVASVQAKLVEAEDRAKLERERHAIEVSGLRRSHSMAHDVTVIACVLCIMVLSVQVARLEAVALESERLRAEAAERYEDTIRSERRERYDERAEVLADSSFEYYVVVNSIS